MDKIDEVCSMHRGNLNACKNMFSKLQKKETKSMCIKTDVTETKCKCKDWIQLAQDGVHCLALVNTGTKLQLPLKL
jgi:hypothetical protein